MGGEADARRGLGLTPNRAPATTAAPTTDERDTDRKVIAAAWPGPWTIVHTATCPDDSQVSECAWDTCEHKVPVGIVAGADGEQVDEETICWDADGLRDPDAEFIARARTRWPQAIERLAEVERAARDYLEATTSSADTASWGDYAQRESRLARLVGYTIPEVERGGAG